MAQYTKIDDFCANVELAQTASEEANAASQGDALVGLSEGKTYQVVLVGACTEKAKNPSTGQTLSFACERIIAHEIGGEGGWFLSTTGITPYAKAGVPSAKGRKDARFDTVFRVSFTVDRKTDKKSWTASIDERLPDEVKSKLKAKFGYKD